MAAGSIAVPSQKFDEFAQKLVETGRYNSPSEVLEAAMDALMREECEDEAKEASLREALDEGEASGIYEGDPFAVIFAKYGVSSRART